MKNQDKKRFAGARILIVHYRVGRSDGVSLEIASWKKMFEEDDAVVALVGGTESLNAEYIINDLEYHHNTEMRRLDELAFGKQLTKEEERQFIEDFTSKQRKISKEIATLLEDFHPTHIIISNIFSVGLGLPIAGGILTVLDQVKIPTILVNHDYYWETTRSKASTVKHIQSYMEKNLPPSRPYIRNFSINRLLSCELFEKKGISSDVLHDSFDFGLPKFRKKRHSSELLVENGVSNSDIVLLQATRIVRRKNIEGSIAFARELQSQKALLCGELYNGKQFTMSSKIHLVLSGYIDAGSENYYEQLVQLAKESSVNLIYLGRDVDRRYQLFDIYPFADIIMYPSISEGFGNQLLESLFARKIQVAFEYPVFKSDIKETGISYISLGEETIQGENGLHILPTKTVRNAISSAIKTLRSSDLYNQWIQKNFYIGRKHFDISQARNIFALNFDRLSKQKEINSTHFAEANPLRFNSFLAPE
ncbi:glycosyltransferase family 4 protein [bacterium]|nr:glycosyltransferase family 4 protein [bacterium]